MALNRHNNDEFEFIASWLAGSSHSINILKRKFSRQEIDAINVPELCEKLKLQLSEEFYNGDNSQTNNTENRIVKLPSTQEKIKFIDFSRLVYGTLILHQQQVDNLLVDTKALYESTNLQISLWNKEFKQIKCYKRKHTSYKSSSNSQRRNSLYHEDSQFIQLLNEAEILANDSTNDNELFEESFTCVQISSNECQMLRRHELKTTIREFNADLTSVVETEFENGFGEVSEEERLFFLNSFNSFTNKSFMDEETTETYMVNHATNRKRKASFEIMDHHHPMDFLCIEMNNSNDNTTSNLNSIELNDNSIFNNDSSMLANLTNPEDMDSFNKIENFDELSNSPNDININHQVIPTTNVLLKPNSDESNVKQRSRKTQKLIIDKSIKFNRQQLETQFEAYYETLDYKIEPNPKQKSAEYLLTNFKLNKIFPHILNNQSKPTTDILIKNNYLLLVREIIGISYDESMANQVYPRWNKRRVYKPKRQSSSSVESMNLSQNDEHNLLLPNMVVVNTNNDDDDDDDEKLVNDDDDEDDDEDDFNDYNNNSNKSNNSSPYDIMIQLIDILSVEAREEIEMSKFLNTLPSRMVAALAFRHLLDLVRDSYIIITTKPDSIEAKTISLGPQSHKLFKKLRINKILT